MMHNLAPETRATLGTLIAFSALALAGCASGSQLPVPPDDQSAVVVGSLGPGSPPDGEAPERLELTFSGPGNVKRATVARDGEYEVTLPAGTWEVRAADGQVCTTGLTVMGGTSQRVDLVYPAGECFSVSPDDGPAAPPAPPSG